jgi:hypothetical protein
MRVIGAQKYTSQDGMGLLVHVRWNPFTPLLLITFTCTLVYLTLLIKHFWYIVENTTKRGRMTSKSIFPIVCRGILQCVMANPSSEPNEQLREMARTIQVLHQKLEDSQLELAKVRQHDEEALDEIDEWRSRVGLPKINEVEDVSCSSPCKRCYPRCHCSHTIFKK